MIEQHYINFGMPKSGTSWIWNQIKVRFDYTRIKEPNLDICNSDSTYIDFFSPFKKSLNFNTNLWQLDSQQLDFLSMNSTHRTIIFRNPYSFANSYYNFIKEKNNSFIFLNTFKIYFDYVKIAKRLKEVKILLYDDLVKDGQSFIDNLLDYLDLDRVIVDSEYVNQTNYKNNIEFTKDQIIRINQNIDQFQDYIKRDLEHWKMHV